MDSQNKSEKFPPYQVIESHEFALQFAQLVNDAKLRDDLQREFYDVLPLDPERFQEIPGITVQGITLRAVTIECFPVLTLYFTIKDRVITLLEIHPL